MNEIKNKEWFNWKLSYNSYLNVMKFHKILWKVHFIKFYEIYIKFHVHVHKYTFQLQYIKFNIMSWN